MPRPFQMFVLLVALPAPASAEPRALTDGRLGKRVDEKRHRVEASVEGWVATTTVTMELQSSDWRPKEAIYTFSTPPGAAVTGLAAKVKGRWVTGSLLDAAAVRRRLKNPRGLPARYDPAWLEQVGESRYRLRIYPVPGRRSGRRAFVRFTYTHQLELRWGRRIYVYPRRGRHKNLSNAVVTIRDRSPITGTIRRHVARVSGRVALSRTLVDPPIKAGRPLRATLLVRPRIGSTAGQGLLVLQGNPNAYRRKWGTDVVFVVDRSLSMWKSSLQTIDTIVHAVVREAGKGTRFAFTTFNNEGHRLHTGLQWATRAALRAGLARLRKIRASNGTRIQAGLRHAYALLRKGSLARRRLLVVVSDGLFPEKEQDAASWPRAPKHTEVLALIGRPFLGGARQWTTGPLATFARDRGGVSFAFDPFSNTGVAGTMDRTHLSALSTLVSRLSRPGRVIGMSLTVDGRRRALTRRDLPMLAGITQHWTFSGQAPKQAALSFSYWGRRRTLSVHARPLAAREATLLRRLRNPAAKERVSHRRSLIALDPADRFARDRLAFARRWGARFFSRMAPPGSLDLTVKRWRRGPGGMVLPGGRSQLAGRLTKKIVGIMLSKHFLQAATRCYQASGPYFKRGRALLNLDLTRGEVADAWITHSTMGQAALHRCLVSAALALRVARSWGDNTVYRVTYPMRFRPKQRRVAANAGWKPPRPRPKPNPLRGLNDLER